MSSNWRRFEVLLPLRFNDGRDVPPEWLAAAYHSSSTNSEQKPGPIAISMP